MPSPRAGNAHRAKNRAQLAAQLRAVLASIEAGDLAAESDQREFLRDVLFAVAVLDGVSMQGNLHSWRLRTAPVSTESLT